MLHPAHRHTQFLHRIPRAETPSPDKYFDAKVCLTAPVDRSFATDDVSATVPGGRSPMVTLGNAIEHNRPQFEDRDRRGIALVPSAQRPEGR